MGRLGSGWKDFSIPIEIAALLFLISKLGCHSWRPGIKIPQETSSQIILLLGGSMPAANYV